MTIALLTCPGVQSWCSDFRSAATPATCGVAIDVPLRTEYVLPGVVDRTSTPGAASATLAP